MTQIKEKVVLFDFFGVICPDLVDVWLSSRGLTNRLDEIRVSCVHPGDVGEISFLEVCERLADNCDTSPQTVLKELLDISRIDGEVASILDELKTDCFIALCSNSPRGLIEMVCGKNSYIPPFHSRIISGEVGFMKPDKRMFTSVLSMVHCLPQNAVLIDDRKRNIDAAESIGMATILYQTPTGLRRRLTDLRFLH